MSVMLFLLHFSCLSVVDDFLTVSFKSEFRKLSILATLSGLDCALRRSFSKKARQLSVHFVRVCPGYAVRPVLHHR
jgi:hypothetical protein